MATGQHFKGKGLYNEFKVEFQKFFYHLPTFTIGIGVSFFLSLPGNKQVAWGQSWAI
jgi:hypothetical protein